jgi:hypothetical protein
LLLTYASDRVTSRGAGGQADIIERPGLQLDFVARQGITVAGKEVELKLEVRNLTNNKYRELQENGDNRVFYNRYKEGISASLGIDITF